MGENLCCCFKGDLNRWFCEDRKTVHERGIWHKTSHVWLYDDDGYVYFQIRKDSTSLYTSASGHVLAFETPEDAAVREAKEELGINLVKELLELIEIYEWVYDTDTKKDHAYAHVYLYKVPTNFSEFTVDTSEVLGVRKVYAPTLLTDLIKDSKRITPEQRYPDGEDCPIPCPLLVMANENALLKYGKILDSVKRRTQANY